MTTKFLFNFMRRGAVDGHDLTPSRVGHKSDSIVSRFSLVSLICVLMLTLGVGNAWANTTDNLTYSVIGLGYSGNNDTYTNFTNKAATSDARYAGQILKFNKNKSLSTDNYLQFKATNPSGIVTTTSGGTAVSVTITWTSSNSNGRTVDVYGKTTAYETGADLYDNSKKGTKLGSIVYGTSTKLTIDGSYQYIGIRSSSGTAYASNIAIEWSTGGGSTPSVTPDPTSLDWGTVLQGSSQSTKTISITGANLTAGTLSISASGGYSVTPTSQSVSGTLSATTLTVTPPSTSTTGTKNGTVTISGGGLASNVVVNLSMTVNAASTVTWMNNGSEYTTTLVENSTKPTLPANPSSCDATSDTFYGWSTAEWSGAIDDIGSKTIYTDASAMPAVTGDVTYYAVFAKAEKSNNYQLLTDDNDFISGEDYLIEEYFSSTDHVLKAANYNSKTYQQVSYNSWSLPDAGTNFNMTDALFRWKITSEGNGQYSIYNASANKYLVLVDVESGGNHYKNLILSSTKDANFNRIVTESAGYSDQFTFESSTESGYYIYCNGDYFQASSSTATQYLYKRVTTYSKYRTNCCTALGTINGSFLWTAYFIARKPFCRAT